jgi:tetrapyrrole methylase family protein/MazG family protein/ATP diphosphatase
MSNPCNPACHKIKESNSFSLGEEMPETNKMIQAVGRLLEIMARLRSPGGCPWDAEQTPETLKPYLLEEVYEVLEAIDHGIPAAILDELGDLLLQVVFQARIFEERGAFDFGDVAAAIADKLVRRHPHVFGDLENRDRASLDVLWNQIKDREKAAKGERTPDMGDIPRNMPSLLRARKLAEKTNRKGEEAILPTVREALNAFEKAREKEDRNSLEDSFGTLLFALVNMGRVMDLDAEEALRMTLNRFITARTESKDSE